ncbi:transposase [Methylocaldum marinum]|uniref:transposase n=1 Tax=Methylocaldum marinum TaxID=1432792 RepID=UPI0014748961|nr:transposase [Methylocaldum marinum]
MEEARSSDRARVALDEFALRSVPDTHYAWAERNTAPRVPSDERQRTRLNGFLTVDLHRGLTGVQFRSQGKTGDVVFVVVLTVLRYVQQGCHWITLILDNARTHRHALEVAARELLSEIAELAHWPDLKATTVEFPHTPPVLARSQPGRVSDPLGSPRDALSSTLHLHAPGKGGSRSSPSRPGAALHSRTNAKAPAPYLQVAKG